MVVRQKADGNYTSSGGDNNHNDDNDDISGGGISDLTTKARVVGWYKSSLATLSLRER